MHLTHKRLIMLCEEKKKQLVCKIVTKQERFHMRPVLLLNLKLIFSKICPGHCVGYSWYMCISSGEKQRWLL